MKRFISLTLTVVMMLGLFAGIPISAIKVSAVNETGDDGTANRDFIVPVTHQKTVPDGYIGVYTAQDLDNVRNNLSGKYILMNNIDLASWGNWEPIGSDGFSSFKGIFNGNGYLIKNMTINIDGDDDTVYAGLFGYVASSGKIQNIGIINSTINVIVITSSNIWSGWADVGGIAGYTNAEITNCFSKSDIDVIVTMSSHPTFRHEPVFARSGGIVGYTSSTIADCYSEGNITVSSVDYVSVGGIVGSISSGIKTIKNCFSRNNLYGSWNGGNYIMGGNSEGIDVNVTIEIGGILGNAAGTLIIDNCAFYGDISIVNEKLPAICNYYPGGMVGYANAGSNVIFKPDCLYMNMDLNPIGEQDTEVTIIGLEYVNADPEPNTDTTIELAETTYNANIGEEIYISGIFSSTTLEANSNTLTWSCSDETAVTFGQMSVVNTLEEAIISIPVTTQKAGSYTVTVKSNDGAVAQTTVIVNRVNFDTDVWNYNTMGTPYGNPRDEIPVEFFKNIWGTVKGVTLHAFDDGTKGQCYGMSATVGTINDNLPKVNSFYITLDGVKTYQDKLTYLSRNFYNDEIGMTTSDFIKYGQLMTQSNEISKQRWSTKDKLNELYNAVKDFQNGTGDPVIIDIRGGIGKGHALYALRIENDISEGCNIIVYDCNYSHPKKLYLFKENGSFNKWAYEFDEENGVFWGTGEFANYITYTTPSSLLYDTVKLVSDKNISRSAALNSIDSNLLLVSDVVLEQSNLIPIMSYNSEVKNYYWVEDKKTLSFSAQENPLNLTLADSYSGISATIGANSNIILNVADNIKNSAQINTTNNSDFSLSNLFVGEDENINSMTINGISKGNVEMLEAENGIFFTGADNITITAEIDGKEISQEFADVTSDDYIKVVLSNDNGGIEIITLDYNPFEIATIIKGDLNGDGEADIADAQIFLEYLVGNYELSDTQLLAAKDFNGQSALKSLRAFLGFVTKN